MQKNIIPYNSHLKELARKLRNESTIGERILWNQLKNKKSGYDFHRQKPLLNYIVDFYCQELRLVIEIDGKYHYHEEKSLLDIKRDEELKTYHLSILRFTEIEIRNDLLNVLRVIETYILDYQEKGLDKTST